jgi:hypothetical protein
VKSHEHRRALGGLAVGRTRLETTTFDREFDDGSDLFSCTDAAVSFRPRSGATRRTCQPGRKRLKRRTKCTRYARYKTITF